MLFTCCIVHMFRYLKRPLQLTVLQKLMKFVCLSVVLIFTKYFVSAQNNSYADQFAALKAFVSDGRPLSSQPFYPRECPVLLENDGELIEIVLATADHVSLENFLINSCKDNEEVIRKIIQVAVEYGDLSALAKIKSIISYMENPMLKVSKKVLFEECASKMNYKCVEMFAKELCTVTDRNGGNLLHIAAQRNDETLLEMAPFCKLLINQKDLNDKFPMEYVQSREIAQKLNDKWLEVAKDHFLSLESSRVRLEMHSRFNLETEENYSDEISATKEGKGNRLFLKDAFETGINDAEEIFCPYLKMKVNLLEGKGRDPSGMLLEWLAYLLNDIFSPLDAEENEEGNFKYALFTRNSDNEYVPTGKYSLDVYDFVGKIISTAHYFGLGHNIKLSDCKGNPDVFAFYEAIRNGGDKMKFLRTEIHQVGDFDVLALRGRNVFVQIIVDDGHGPVFKYIKNTTYVYRFIKAFESLTDAQKMKFVSLVLKKDALKDGHLKVSLTYSISGDFRIHKWMKNIEIRKFESSNEFKEVLNRMTQ